MKRKSNLVKFIIIIIILLLIAMCVILIIFQKSKKINNETDNEVEVDYLRDYEEKRAEQGITENDAVAILESNPDEYYCVKGIIDNFCIYVDYLNADSDKLDLIVEESQEEAIKKQYRQDGIKAIRGMLAENYINEKNITNESIYSLLGRYSYQTYNINYMFDVEDSDYIHTYYVYGGFSNSDDDTFNFIIILDRYNYTFEIYLNDYVSEKKYRYDDISSMKTLHIKSVKSNEYNKFEYKSISRESIAIDYYNSFIDLIDQDINSAYSLLDEEYKKIKFDNINGFKQYMSSRIEELKNASIEGYFVKKYDSYTDYVCVDSLGNNYMFRSTAVNKYSVFLDSYTIKLDEYYDEYNNVNDNEKAKKCISRFFEMINQEDYEAAYNVLNKSFKEKNFSTLDSFKQYVSNNWFKYNYISSCQISKSNNNSILDIDLLDKRNMGSFDSIVVSKTFIIKLGENISDFELSFSMN